MCAKENGMALSGHVVGLLKEYMRDLVEQAKQETTVTGFFRRALPGFARRRLERTPFAQDVMIGHVQFVLEKP
jgi:hypothetical protein